MSKTSVAILALSLVVPGSGQIWNRETKKGLIIFGCCVGLGYLTYWLSGLNKLSMALALILLWTSAALDACKAGDLSGQPREFYYRKRYVVVMLLLVGPLALPLLWQSPHFSRLARWIWTAIVVAATLLFIASPYFMGSLLGRAPEMTSGS